MTDDFDLKGKASSFVNDIKTIKWLRKNHYEKAVSTLHENEIKIMAELEEKYAPLDVVQMLLDEHDNLRRQVSIYEKALEKIHLGDINDFVYKVAAAALEEGRK